MPVMRVCSVGLTCMWTSIMGWGVFSGWSGGESRISAFGNCQGTWASHALAGDVVICGSTGLYGG